MSIIGPSCYMYELLLFSSNPKKRVEFNIFIYSSNNYVHTLRRFSYRSLNLDDLRYEWKCFRCYFTYGKQSNEIMELKNVFETWTCLTWFRHQVRCTCVVHLRRLIITLKTTPTSVIYTRYGMIRLSRYKITRTGGREKLLGDRI